VTNYGDTAADLTGFRFDDNTFSFGASVALNGVSSIAPGQSVIFIEGTSATADTFQTDWGLTGVPVGYYSGAGVGLSSGGDGAVLFDSLGNEITRVSFGAATAGTSFYWSYDASGNLSTSASGTLTVSSLPGYRTWQNGSTTMQGTPGAAVTVATANFLFWKGGTGTWTATGGTDWTPLGNSTAGPWSSNATAVFQGTAGTVTLAAPIVAEALNFGSSGYLVTGESLTLSTGVVTVAAGASSSIASTLDGASGLSKLGAGNLTLTGTSIYSGTTSVVEGNLLLAPGAALPPASPITTARFTTFDFGGNSATVGGLGGTGNFVGISGNLTIQNAGNITYRLDGTLSGPANVIVNNLGTGAQRFDTTGQSRADGAAKSYTGQTIVRRGVLQIDESGIPTQTSGIRIEGDETGIGEILLTTDGGVYEFGIDLPSLPVITLAGGVLGNEARETLELYNDLLITGEGSAIASRGAGDGVTTFDGEFHMYGTISGSANLRKTGQGILLLHTENPSFSGQWLVQNGVLLVESGASSGTGGIAVQRVVSESGETVGVLTGRGNVGGNVTVAGELHSGSAPGALSIQGNLAFLNGGVLVFDPTTSSAISASGAFSADQGSTLLVSGNVTVGSYNILQAAASSDFSQMTVTGLPDGLYGSLSATGNTLVLEVTNTPPAISFFAWAGGALPNSDANSDGFSALAEYGLGANAPASGVNRPVLVYDANAAQLTLTAIIRANDPQLTVSAQASSDLTNWTTNNVSSEPAADQTGVPEGCERRVFRTPLDGAKKFLRLFFNLSNS
jgi:autotransporter-associated beta strand protein